MKKNLIVLLSLLAFSLLTITAGAQKKTMTWTTPSEDAKTLCGEGTDLFFNIDFAQAYEKMNAALKLDPNFTVALVFMTNLTRGELQKKYRERVAKSLKDKTEGEKLFASTAEEGSTPEKNRETFAKLYNMFPDGSMIGANYVFSRENPEEQFKACEEYHKKFPDEAWVYNIMGYYYMQEKKDMVKAKEYFQKYIDAYPDGCNPFDSMGEYYFNNGDMENSRKYYRMALDKYPFNSSSVNKLADMRTIPSKMYGFTPEYSANFVMAPATNTETVLALWQEWKDGDLSKSRVYFADSISFFLADGTQMVGPADDLLKGMQDYRSSFTGMEVGIDAVFAVRSADKNEDWVTIWGTEKQTKDGKVNSVSLQETWRFNKNGKIDLMFQAERKGIMPPPPAK
jgi:tetratricopeptide (TPR) repeat protein